MIVSPGAKINLGLYITGKRPDGYHNLLTLFYPIGFSDSLEVIPAPANTQDADSFPWANKLAPQSDGIRTTDVQGLPIRYSASGIQIKGALTDNLCIKAYSLLKADYPALPAVSMHLHKNVPMGAGLGGGSADGATALKVFNELGHLNLSETQLLEYAERLGSDCPFFIKSGPQIATGKGEVLTDIPLSLKGYTLILVCPHIHVPTANAFGQIMIQKQTAPTMESFRQLIQSAPENWKGQLDNQFESSVFVQFPAIQHIKQSLYDLGAVYASMTGSGSSVFGIYKTTQCPRQESLVSFENYFVGQWTL